MSTTGQILPPELEQDIFTLASILHPEYWIQRIEPELYKILMMAFDAIQSPSSSPYRGSDDPLEALRKLHSFMRSRSPDFFRDNVRHLCFTDCHVDSICQMLCPCTLVVNVALHRRLSIYADRLFLHRGAFTHSIFNHITHFACVDWYNCMDWYSDDRAWGFAHIPRLTHLALGGWTAFDEENEQSRDILKQCKTLQVLVSIWSEKASLLADVPYRGELAADDPRFVMLLARNFEEDWEMGARGGEDYWAVADALVKRRGETTAYFVADS
ncbi:hypothetical protein B0H13DRAFT_2279631 [Mycena leptocephala]|nr:hypothetical protein B0H13DRAFT_2279631 [Mycena leptocephala]